MKAKFIKSALYLSTALSFGAAMPAFAAQPAEGAAQPAEQPEADTGYVQPEIVVTARRSEERLQDVPISISVLNQEQIADRNIVSANDLAAYTPSLGTNSRFGAETSTYSIRGFTQENFTSPSVAVYFADVVAPRAQGGTGGGNGGGVGQFWDLQNVQVLRGPQGTLFGRNTTGGAVLLVPTRPTDRFEGYFEGSLGNFEMYRLQGVVNVPLGEMARFRIGADWQQREGYLRNQSGIGPSDFNDINYLSIRASLVVDLTPDLENYTLARFTNSSTNGSQVRIFATNTDANCNPQVIGLVQALIGSTICQQQLARQNARGDSLYDVENDQANARQEIEQWQVINTTSWRVSDNLTLRNIISYAQFTQEQTANIFGTNIRYPSAITGAGAAIINSIIGPILRNNLLPAFIPGFPVGGPLPIPLAGSIPTGAFAGLPFNYVNLVADGSRDNIEQWTFTEEFQIQGQSGDGRLNYQLGAYYEHAGPLGDFQGTRSTILGSCTNNLDPTTCRDVVGGTALLGIRQYLLSLGFPAAVVNNLNVPIPIGQIQNSLTRYEFENIGFYGQGTYRFTDWFALTAGIRYTIDTVDAEGATRQFQFPSGGAAAIRCNRLTTGANGALVITPANGTVISNCVNPFRTRTEDPTWLINADFRPMEDLLLYAKWARGYRQGSINASNAVPNFWDAESMDSYEIGAKWTFRGAVPGYFNISAFRNDIDDLQLNASLTPLPGQNASPAQAIVNAGRARVQGVEIDASISPFRGLNLTVGYAYLDSELLNYDTTAIPDYLATIYQVVPGSNAGDPLPFSPRHRVTATLAYTLPLDETLGRLTVSGTYTYTAEQQQFPDNGRTTAATCNADPLCATPFGVLPATELVNLNLNWNSVGGSNFDLALFMTNVFDEEYITNIGNGWKTAGYEYGTVGAPQMFGARLRYRFGG